MSLLLAFTFCHLSLASFAQQSPPLSAPPGLPLTNADGAAVVGIACDNLSDTPDAQRNRLYLPLPDSLRGSALTFTLTPAAAPAKVKKRRRAPAPVTCGAILQDGDRLIYTPPDEFNANALPQGLRDIDRVSRRTVVLTVRRADGDKSEVARQSIVLARPPLVLVHGINSSASTLNWAGKDRLAGMLSRYGVTPVLVNHGQDDFNHRSPASRPALDFRGNGPVEHAAQRLEEAIAQTLQTWRTRDHLAVRRVDLIGYSYGGVVSRWYLHRFRHDPRSRASVRWYTRSVNSGDPRGLYQLDPAWYRQQLENKEGEKGGVSASGRPEGNISDSSLITHPSSFSSSCPVRKFLTIASMWRGVPLCNYANEIHAPAFSGPQLKQAPILGGALGYFVDGTLAAYLPTRVPSIEVMAVNSPWLAALDGYQEGGQCRPFLENVAYGCVAGDDSAFLGLPGFADNLFDPYATIRAIQVPSWFPYFALETRANSDQNFSDGLVPLWSAVISDNFGSWHPSRIVAANHDTIIASRETLEYVLCALNHRAWLPTGGLLNARWNLPITSRELLPLRDINAPEGSPIPAFALDAPTRPYVQERPREVWKFAPGEMAPTVQNALYPQINGLARLDPLAVREIRDVQIDHITRTSVQISWRTAARLNGAVGVTQWREVNFAAQDDVSVDCRVQSVGPLVTREHRFVISSLQPNSVYHVIVASEAYTSQEAVSIRSDRLQFRTRP